MGDHLAFDMDALRGLPPDHFLAGVAEHPLGPGVELPDYSVRLGRNHAEHRAVQHGTLQLVDFEQGGFSRLAGPGFAPGGGHRNPQQPEGQQAAQHLHHPGGALDFLPDFLPHGQQAPLLDLYLIGHLHELAAHGGWLRKQIIGRRGRTLLVAEPHQLIAGFEFLLRQLAQTQRALHLTAVFRHQREDRIEPLADALLADKGPGAE